MSVSPTMPETPQDARRAQFLLTNLIVLVLFILTLALLLAAYPILLAPPPTLTPTVTNTIHPSATFTITPSPTLSPTPTRTPRPTFTPSNTPTPTITPTPPPSPTPTGPPTLVPALPAGEAINFALATWSPEQADRLIGLIEYYPNTLPRPTPFTRTPTPFYGTPTPEAAFEEVYNAAYAYAVLAQQEALLRFPTSPYAEGWAWQLAYNQARLGLDVAAASYAERIAAGLNRGQTDAERLAQWFHEKEPRLELLPASLQPLAGYNESYLLEVRGAGSAFIWLLIAPDQVYAYPLVSNFDFLQHNPSAFILSDFNQDGINDVAIYQAATPRLTRLAPPRVFSLAKTPPMEMPFAPSQLQIDMGMVYTNYWAVQRDSQGHGRLLFKSAVYPPCPLTVQRSYAWDGSYFEPGFVTYTLDVTPTLLLSCDFMAEQAIRVWGPNAALPILEKIAPLWPPAQDADGKPYPLDATDAMYFRLAIARALAGDQAGARRDMQTIAQHPIISLSRWVKPAQDFLVAYLKPGDIYRACSAVEPCDANQAIQTLLTGRPESEFTQVIPLLWQSGLTLGSSGYFDFDQDGEKETWFTVRNRPREKLTFWIITTDQQGIQALLVGGLENNQPAVRFLDDEENHPAVAQAEEGLYFTFQRDPTTRHAYLTPVSATQPIVTRFESVLQSAGDHLLEDNDPRQARQELLSLQTSTSWTCRVDLPCDSYYYLLGLANELSDHPTEAVEAYFKLWREYNRSPYATMARLKLIGSGIPIATDTPTRTSTPLVTATITSVSSGTPTVRTATPGGPTATRTLTPTPGPSSTPTASYTPGATVQPSPTFTTTPTFTTEPQETSEYPATATSPPTWTPETPYPTPE